MEQKKGEFDLPGRASDRRSGLIHEDVTDSIINAAIVVHSALGPGLLESAYEICLFHALQKRGLHVERQCELPIVFEGIQLESGYRLDLVIENKVLIELKTVDLITPLHEAQLLTYLRLSGLRVGLLINFNTLKIRDGILRRVL